MGFTLTQGHWLKTNKVAYFVTDWRWDCTSLRAYVLLVLPVRINKFKVLSLSLHIFVHTTDTGTNKHVLGSLSVPSYLTKY